MDHLTPSGSAPAGFLNLLERITAGPPSQVAMLMEARHFTPRPPKALPPEVAVLTSLLTIRGPRGDIGYREYRAVKPDPTLFMDGGLTARVKAKPPSPDADSQRADVSDEGAGAADVETVADLRGAILAGVAEALDGPDWLTLDLLWAWSAGLTPTAIVREGLTPLRCPKAVRAQMRAAAERFELAATAGRHAPGAIAAAERFIADQETPKWSAEVRAREAIAGMLLEQSAIIDERSRVRYRVARPNGRGFHSPNKDRGLH